MLSRFWRQVRLCLCLCLHNGVIEAHSAISQLCIPARLSVTLLPFKAAMLCGDSRLLFVPLIRSGSVAGSLLVCPTCRRLSGQARRFAEVLAVAP